MRSVREESPLRVDAIPSSPFATSNVALAYDRTSTDGGQEGPPLPGSMPETGRPGALLIALHQQTITGGAGTEALIDQDPETLLREISPKDSVELPYAAELQVSLAEVLAARRTCRLFDTQALSLNDLGTLLDYAAGAGRTGSPAPMLAGGSAGGRPYPSGGGLYPVEIQIYAARVSDLDCGFYLYQALAHRLVPAAPALAGTELKQMLADHPSDQSAVLVFLCLHLTRASLSKYGLKAYRLALLEAGHLAQNILLVATALGLATLPQCGFDDRAISMAAGRRYPEQPIIYLIAVGQAKGKQARK